ncbi:MAG: class I SAM-dependent methyltransferase family protein [Thermoplasmata archaeon]|nr:MAG: class I SAM-dependent methyltransferase family protein [Thermoplasmata archaeon]
MNSRCIAVPLREGENIRKALLEQGILRNDVAITRDDGFIYFPVTAEDAEQILGYGIQERDFQALESTTKSYRDVVEIPEELREHLPSSFDVIGRIAVIKIPEELMDYGKNIGDAIIEANKSVVTVAVDSGVEGEERLRQLQVVAGINELLTVHKEYGMELEVEPSKVYFSPRLATEHWRIAGMVEEGEVVIDMFCGVGPFSILIARHARPKKVYALDINDSAIELARRNIQSNKVSNVTAICGDSNILVTELEPADRIIMNLPHSAYDFLPAAFSNIRHGGTIHYYEVLPPEGVRDRFADIADLAGNHDIIAMKAGEKEVHTYSPQTNLYCLDLRVQRGEDNV